jgi:hypothetical protein
MRLLCLFSSATLARTSYPGREDRPWSTELDAGRCELVCRVLGAEGLRAAEGGDFQAAVAVCGSGELGPALAGALRQATAVLASVGLALELVPAQAPVSFLAWLQREAPALVPACRADGEVKLDSPSWWRARAQRQLASVGAPVEAAPAPAAVEPEDLRAELTAFVARRRW